MRTRLIRTGDSLTLILDKPLLEQAGIDESTEIEVSTDGDVIVISPVRTKQHSAKLSKAIGEINERYAGVLKRLSE